MDFLGHPEVALQGDVKVFDRVTLFEEVRAQRFRSMFRAREKVLNPLS